MAKQISTTDTEVKPNILMAYDKVKKIFGAVTGIDLNGDPELSTGKEKQNQFIRFEKNGDLFSNFITNFNSQLTNPSRFDFFHAPEKLMKGIIERLGKTFLKLYTMETPTQTDYKFTPEQIDWDTMKGMGLSRERLEKYNLLEPLLKGYKTNELISVNVNLGSVIARTDARLSLQPGENNKALVIIHGIRREPQLNYPFLGHEFTDEDRKNLLTSGNMGRAVELLNPKNGEKIRSLISIDRLTNELVPFRISGIKINDEFRGVKLTKLEKKDLLEGKAVYLKNMVSNKNTLFSGNVQFSADRGRVENLIDAARKLQEAPKQVNGRELTDEEHRDFKEGKTIHLTGLIDKKGQEYAGYFTFNKEEGKIDFRLDRSEDLRAKLQTAESHKTQTAVNNDGKTNEATKNVTEPLQSGQTQPNAAQQQQSEKQEMERDPSQKRGRRL